jgi:hypothetical protein
MTVIRMERDLSKKSLYAPPLNIRVFDDRLVSKPLIATRSISLEPFVEKAFGTAHSAGKELPLFPPPPFF